MSPKWNEPSASLETVVSAGSGVSVAEPSAVEMVKLNSPAARSRPLSVLWPARSAAPSTVTGAGAARVICGSS